MMNKEKSEKKNGTKSFFTPKNRSEIVEATSESDSVFWMEIFIELHIPYPLRIWHKDIRRIENILMVEHEGRRFSSQVLKYTKTGEKSVEKVQNVAPLFINAWTLLASPISPSSSHSFTTQFKSPRETFQKYIHNSEHLRSFIVILSRLPIFPPHMNMLSFMCSESKTCWKCSLFVSSMKLNLSFYFCFHLRMLFGYLGMFRLIKELKCSLASWAL